MMSLPSLKSRPLFLVLSLFALLLIYPIFHGGTLAGVVLATIFTVLLISAVFSARENAWLKWMAILLGGPWVVTSWTSQFITLDRGWYVANLFSLVSFCGVMIVLNLLLIHRSLRVTSHVIYRAIAVYLLLGVLWAGLYGLSQLSDPAALTTSSNDAQNNLFELLYFSFCTLSTLGPGDIVARSNMARSMVMIESIIGPLYLAVLLARLVAIFSNEQTAVTTRHSIEDDA
jgi:hypothetical protein